MSKRNKLIGIIATVTAVIMIFGITAFAEISQKNAVAHYNDIKIVVDGNHIIPTDVNGNIVDPFIIDGTTYLPVRALATALGQGVRWEAETSTVYIGGVADEAVAPNTSVTEQGAFSKEVVLSYNDIKINVNNAEITPQDANGNSVEPFIIDGTTYLPVRALATALGENVDWDQATSTVIIGEKSVVETPAETELFKVDSAILSTFSEKTLATVGDIPVKGSYYNINIAQTCNSAMFEMMCDNYSADKTLQTITMNSYPAAKILADTLTDSFHPMFAVYAEAEKTGFTKKPEIQQFIEATLKSYKSQFKTDEEFRNFLSESAISEKDFNNYITMNAVYSVYADDLYSRYTQIPYTDEEIVDICKKEFVKAKHILVQDAETAQKIISELSAGKDFHALTDEYNLDSGQPYEGYTFTRGEMVPEFEKAAFDLAENTYTKSPVKSVYGYHIIYRYSIDAEWAKANIQAIISAIASRDTDNVISTLKNNSALKLTADYDTYVTTIK